MFTGLMLNTWIAASIVAVLAGVLGFFAVLRGQSFAAHAIPNGAFAGAAGAGLLGLNVIWGLAVFAVAGALGIGALGRRARQDVVTALVLVLMLGTGALFLSLSTEYSEVTYSLLFGEVFGIGSNVLLPIAALGAVSVAVIALLYRPLLLASALPEVADARGVSTRRMELCFLIVMALATSMTVPVVGALLMFALMIGPAAAARSFTRRPGHAIALAIGIALATVWIGIAASYHTNWPLGFFVGVIAAGFFLAGQVWSAVRRRWWAPRPAPALGSAVLVNDFTKCLVNQSLASVAAAVRAPGSSNRWVAPGTTSRRFSQRSMAWAWRFRSRTAWSSPPTMSSVGAVTLASRSPARSGRPPRETTATTPAPGSAAAHSAA
ncbi:metal ABC transporter permease, partial [Trebonia sp.]|uniref:metal ABC transporter permease n=1 Tax=Trebonia sp. TaxID=2767075 RepID=UPI003BB18290